MALQWLLVRAGREAYVLIGVEKDDVGEFVAHAWVKSDDKLYLESDSAVGRFRPIAALPAQSDRDVGIE